MLTFLFFMTGFVLFVVGIVFLIKRKSTKKIWIGWGVCTVLFFGSLSSEESTPVATPDVETEVSAEEDVDEEKVEESKKEEPKQELYIKLVAANHDPASEVITIETETNLPDNTVVYFALKGDEENDYPVVPDSAEVKDGKISVTLGDYEDEYDGRELIPNGKFKLHASFSVDSERDANTHITEAYGNYDDFKKKYTINGDSKETDNGFLVENISLGEMDITEGYSEEEIASLQLEKKKSKATTIDFKQLDKNADRHAGEYVTYTGEIVQIMEGDNVTQIRLAVTEESYGYNPSELIFVEYEGYTDFVEEDIVTIYGTVYGSFTYTSQAGYNISLPGILADIIE